LSELFIGNKNHISVKARILLAWCRDIMGLSRKSFTT